MGDKNAPDSVLAKKERKKHGKETPVVYTSNPMCPRLQVRHRLDAKIFGKTLL
jgi:hypothetical protein